MESKGKEVESRHKAAREGVEAWVRIFVEASLTPFWLSPILGFHLVAEVAGVEEVPLCST